MMMNLKQRIVWSSTKVEKQLPMARQMWYLQIKYQNVKDVIKKLLNLYALAAVTNGIAVESVR